MYQNITASCYSGGDPRTFRRSGDDGRGVETIVGPRPHSRHQDSGSWLLKTLNARIKDPNSHYKPLLYKNLMYVRKQTGS